MVSTETVWPVKCIAQQLLRLRIHPKQEWSDLYDPENVNDLTKFYDYFVKGKENDWRSTPPVRVSLLGFNKVSFGRHFRAFNRRGLQYLTRTCSLMLSIFLFRHTQS